MKIVEIFYKFNFRCPPLCCVKLLKIDANFMVEEKHPLVNVVSLIVERGLVNQKNKYALLKAYRFITLFLTHILKTSEHFKYMYSQINSIFLNKFIKSKASGLYERYSFVFPRHYHAQKEIAHMFYLLFRYKDVTYLILFLRGLFKNVNFFKHRYLLNFLRAVFEALKGPKAVPGIRGLFIKFKGKLGQAGNSRRKRYLLAYGQVTTNYTNNYIVEKFQIRTFTGAIGCSVILCYY